MDQRDLELLKVAQDGVLFTERPYQILGEMVGMSEQEVVDRLRALQDEGIIRRFAATIGHRALGIVANAMIAWRAPATRGPQPQTGLTIFTLWCTPQAKKTAWIEPVASHSCQA